MTFAKGSEEVEFLRLDPTCPPLTKGRKKRNAQVGYRAS